MKIKVYDFFSGCGGTSAGLQAAGMEIAFGLDIDPDAAATFQSNFPGAYFLQKDLTRLRTNRLQTLLSKTRKAQFCFVVAHHASRSQSRIFSGNRRIAESPLLSHFGRFVRYYRPEFVLVENVPGLQKYI